MDARVTRTGERAAAMLSDKGGGVRTALRFLMMAAIGALLQSAELLFDARPFGVALAAASTGTFFPASALGAAVYAVFTRDFLSVATLALLGVIRMLSSLLTRDEARYGSVFEERLRYRMLAALLCVFATSTFALCREQFRSYFLFSLLAGVIVAPLCTLLLGGVFEKKEENSEYVELGIGCLLFLCVFAMRTVSFAGIYPSIVAAVFCSFWLVAHRGILVGTLGGGVLGLALGVEMMPVCLLCAVGFGLLERSSRGGGILVGGGLGILYTFAVLGSVRSVAVLPALLTAGALFLAGDSAGLVEGTTQRLSLWRRRAAVQAARSMALEWQEERMQKLSSTFSDLSDVLSQLGSRGRRPGTAELRHLCDRAFDETCPTCEHRAACWGSEYVTTAASVTLMAERLRAGERAEYTHLDAALVARCACLDTILSEINEGAQRLCEEAIRGDKISVIAADCEALARVIDGTLKKGTDLHATDEAIGERVALRLRRAGYTLDSVTVCGTQHRRVLLRGLRLPSRRPKLREVRSIVEQQCGFLLGEAVMHETDGVPDVLYEERVALSVHTAKCSRAKSQDGSYCGDSVVSFDTEEGYSYAFLCDGMGSGNSAALTSTLSGAVLSRLLSGGSDAGTALWMLCSVLLARGRRQNEASTTVDLLEIDRVSGRATVFKCGAAPTYVMREGRITRYFSRTAPIGIFDTPDVEKLTFSVEPGDVIVQVSDGVTGGEEDCPWLADMLLTRYNGDARCFAECVIARAAKEERDDLSILVTEVRSAPFCAA